MRSTRVAEWILAQVTTRQRAEAVIGDLLEKVPARGALWFWWSVATTAVALVWRDVTTNPIRMFGLGLAGFVLVTALVVLVILAASLAFAALVGVLAFTGMLTGRLDPHRLEGLPQWISGGWGLSAVNLVSVCVAAWAQFLVGRWLARRSPDHELAPCVACSIVGLTLSLAFAVVFRQQLPHPIRDATLSVLFIVLDLPLYAGAVSVRRKRAGLQ